MHAHPSSLRIPTGPALGPALACGAALRRRVALACALIVAGLGALQPVSARELDAVRASGTLRLATEGAFPPFNFFQGERLTGYEVEVAEAVAARLQLKLEWKALPFDGLIAAVRQGRFDAAIASHGYTEERARSVDFIAPHYCSGGQIVARGRALGVKDLQGRTVAVQLATTYADAVARLPGLKEVRTLPKDTDALAALMAGRVDAWVSDRFVARSAVEKHAAAGLVRGELVFTERISMVLKKDQPALRAALHEAVEQLQRDGTLARLSQKWFGEDVTCRD